MRLLFAFAVFLPIAAFAMPASIDSKKLDLPPQAPPCNRLDLHSAVQSKKPGCLDLAISHMDINDRDVNGNTPLHNAVRFRNSKAIRFLVKHGADLHLRDFNGFTAREIAENQNNRRLGNFLSAIERETERLFEAVDANDIVAASNSLLRGASLGTRGIRLDTPLHTAAQSNLVEMAILLIHQGAQLEARNYLGETPLHMAALRNFPQFTAMLIEAGANVNAINERRYTPLDIAEAYGETEILTLLKKKKARNGTPASVELEVGGGDGGGGGAREGAAQLN